MWLGGWSGAGQAGNPNTGRVDFVPNVEANQQGGDGLDQAGRLKRADINGVDIQLAD